MLFRSLGNAVEGNDCGKAPKINTNVYKIKNLAGLFDGCKSLSKMDSKNNKSQIDVSGIKTDFVSDMSRMFRNCHSIEKVDGIFGFNTNSCESFESMFEGCFNLKTFAGNNIPGYFNTPKVKSTKSMFKGCYRLKDLGMNSVDAPNLENMDSMFEGCANLTTIDLQNLSGQNLKSMNKAFKGCVTAQDINLNKCTTPNLESMNEAFAELKGIARIDISNLNNKNVPDKNKTDVFKSYIDENDSSVYKGQVTPVDVKDWIKLGENFTFKSEPGQNDVPFYNKRYITKNESGKPINIWDAEPWTCNTPRKEKSNLVDFNGNDVKGKWQPARVMVIRDYTKDGFENHYITVPLSNYQSLYSADASKLNADIKVGVDVKRPDNWPNLSQEQLETLGYPCHKNFTVDTVKDMSRFHLGSCYEHPEWWIEKNPTLQDQLVLYATPNWAYKAKFIDADRFNKDELGSVNLPYFDPGQPGRPTYYPVPAYETAAVSPIDTMAKNFKIDQPEVPDHDGWKFKGWKIVGDGDKVYNWTDTGKMPTIQDLQNRGLFSPDGQIDHIEFQAVYEEVSIPPATALDSGNSAIGGMLASSIVLGLAGVATGKKYFSRK